MITLQFVGSDSLSSRFIELKGGGPYSHVDIVLPDETLLGARDDVVGGQPSGVHIRPAGYETWERVARVHVECTEEQAAIAYAYAKAQLGKPYDSTAILAFIFNRDWKEEDSWFCSELAIATIRFLFKYPPATSVNKIDPCMAFALASTLGAFTVIK